VLGVNTSGGDDHVDGGPPVYDTLVIVASSSATAIWLGEDAGHLVQTAVRALRTSPLPRNEVVAYGLGTSPSPIHRTPASRYPQSELAAGRTCSRPMPQRPSASGSAKMGCHAFGALVTGAPSRPTSGWSRRGDPRGSPPACVPGMRSCLGVKVPGPGVRGAEGPGKRKGVAVRRGLKAAWNARAGRGTRTGYEVWYARDEWARDHKVLHPQAGRT
jgi:hypothetical protein